MPINKGKKWESCVKSSWESSFPSSLILRLPDQQSGYKGTSANPSDLIGFVGGKLFFIECKTVATGNTLSLDRLTQYDILCYLENYIDVNTGFIVWWQEKEKIAWVPTKTVSVLKAEGKKSINVSMLNGTDYTIIDVPFEVKRVYPTFDFNDIIRFYGN